ncbi:MAG: hypothetical protein KDC87_15485 [Planctomycetes bacterium]|nr:hypothetical protein [Planctomycetota bacterium]
MAAKKKANVLDFAREYLRNNRTAPYAEVRDAAKKRKLTLYPISYGRAQALEGIVKVAKYGSKKKEAKRAGKAAAGATRGRGRPRGSKSKVSSGLESIDGLVQTVKNLQAERDDAVRLLDRIRALLDAR